MGFEKRLCFEGPKAALTIEVDRLHSDQKHLTKHAAMREHRVIVAACILQRIRENGKQFEVPVAIDAAGECANVGCAPAGPAWVGPLGPSDFAE